MSAGYSHPKLHVKISAVRQLKIPFGVIIIIRNLSNDGSKASSKTIPPHSAI